MPPNPITTRCYAHKIPCTQWTYEHNDPMIWWQDPMNRRQYSLSYDVAIWHEWKLLGHPNRSSQELGDPASCNWTKGKVGRMQHIRRKRWAGVQQYFPPTGRRIRERLLHPRSSNDVQLVEQEHKGVKKKRFFISHCILSLQSLKVIHHSMQHHQQKLHQMLWEEWPEGKLS